MLQSSITAWLKKPASVKKAGTSSEPLGVTATNSTSPFKESPTVSDAAALQTPQVSSVPADNTSTTPFTLKPLPANVELVPLTEGLMPAFKRLNSLLLPVAYPPAFYTETMTEPHYSLTLMALWHSASVHESPSPTANKPHAIGAIRCRILSSSTLYISTIGILSPYRSYGIATHLLHEIALKASEDHGVKSITAHVWEANEEGLEWYSKRGFEIIGKEDGYYRKLKPSGAILVRKRISIGDLLSNTNAFNGQVN